MAAEETPQIVQEIPIQKLVPCQLFEQGQPRTHYDEEGLEELADSIRQNGVLQPLLVRSLPNEKWEILGGHRRHLAAQKAHINSLPCIVREVDDDTARMLVVLDNLSREDFLPWEEGQAYRELMSRYDLSAQAIAQKTGKSEATIKERLVVADASEALRQGYLDGDLSMYALQEIARLPNEILSPKRCPGCQGVCAEDANACPACQTDLSGIYAFPAGNPQDAAARLCKQKTNGAVKDFVERVRESYGLARQTVQTSLGLDDQQLSQEAVEVRSKLQRMLEQVGIIGTWLLKDNNSKAVSEYSSTQKGAIRDQVTAARTVLARIEQAVTAQEVLL